MPKTPADFSNLWAWYKADAGVTGTTTVTAWADQSGNGRNLSSESTKEPALVASAINSLPVISAFGKSVRMFTGVNFPDLSAGGIIYFIGRQKTASAVTSGDSGGAWLGAGSTVNAQLIRGNASGSGYGSIRGGINTDDTNSPETTTQITENTFFTVRLRYNGTNNYLSINGGTEVQVAASGGGYVATPLTIFKTLSAPYGNKELLETVIFTGTQTTQQMTLLEYYFNQRGAHYTWSGGVPTGWDDAAAVITFPTLSTKHPGDANFSPGATSTNTVTAITYSSSDASVATIVSGQIHIVGNGTATITASQAAGNGYGAATDVTRTLTVTTNTNTMADVANLLSGKVVSLAFATNLTTPVYKTIVCSTGDINVNGTQTSGAETATRCGVHKAAGTSGWEIGGAGAANSVLSTTEMSINEVAALFAGSTTFRVRVQLDSDPTKYYREGTGYLSAYKETAAIDGFVGFDFTVAISGTLDLTA